MYAHTNKYISITIPCFNWHKRKTKLRNRYLFIFILILFENCLCETMCENNAKCQKVPECSLPPLVLKSDWGSVAHHFFIRLFSSTFSMRVAGDVTTFIPPFCVGICYLQNCVASLVPLQQTLQANLTHFHKMYFFHLCNKVKKIFLHCQKKFHFHFLNFHLGGIVLFSFVLEGKKSLSKLFSYV